MTSWDQLGYVYEATCARHRLAEALLGEGAASTSTDRSDGEIGRALYISRNTASVHVSNILRKLGVANRAEAAALGVRVGLVEPPPRAATS